MPRKLYAFDFDDNIAATDACIRTSQGRISTAAYAGARAGAHTLLADAFVEFTRWRACKLSRGPFFDTFLRALDEKAPVVVISARSLNQRDFRALLRRAAALATKRLNGKVQAFCVNNARTRTRFGAHLCTADLKAKILLHFLKRRPMSWSLGFSDDDPVNLKAMRKALRLVSARRRVCIYNARTQRKSVL